MLTYPQNFVSRFAPMANGTMAVVPGHLVPYLASMNEPGNIPKASANLGGPDPKAARDLARIGSQLVGLAPISFILEDGLVKRLPDGTGFQWGHGDGSIRWDSVKHGHHLVALNDGQTRTSVLLNVQNFRRLEVEVGRSSKNGRFSQTCRVSEQGEVTTAAFEIEADLGLGRGGDLPFFSGWHFMAGGISCFDPSQFLVDLMELNLATQAGQGPVTVSFESCEEGRNLGSWDFPREDQTVTLAGFSPIERSLAAAAREVDRDQDKIYFSFHRQGDPKRGVGEHALPVSVGGVLSKTSLSVNLLNAGKSGLMKLPRALEPVLTAFFPKSGE